MCGLSGFSLAPSEVVNARHLSAALLLGIEHRGKDATGAAWRLQRGNIGAPVELQKRAVPAWQFVRGALSVPRRARTCVLHTRFATQGSESNNMNNHPIRVGSLVGAHNGVLYNDDALFRKAGVTDKRIAQVDSEAIFANLFYGEHAHPIDSLKLLEGSAAVAWMDERDDNDTLHVARADHSPVCWAQTEAGSFVFASTFDAIDGACTACGLKLAHADAMDEGTYFRIRGGMVAESTTFIPATPPRWATYNSPSAWSWKDDYDDAAPQYGRPLVVDTTPNGDDEALDDVDDYSSLYIIEDLDPTVDVPDLSGEDYWSEYCARECAIDAWMNGLNDDPGAEGFKAAAHLKAYVKPGQWVETRIHGEMYYGQLYSLPQTFPWGWYGVMCQVPASYPTENHPTETVLVRRMAPDFTMVSKSGAIAHIESMSNAPEEATAPFTMLELPAGAEAVTVDA